MTAQPLRSEIVANQKNHIDGATPAVGPDDLAIAAGTLARLLGSPEPLDLGEAAEALDILATVPGSPLAEMKGDPARFQSEWNEQRNLYAGVPGLLPLEESVYKVWTTDRSHPLAGRKGLTWGDPAGHMLEVLQSFGMIPDPEDPRSPDHIAVLFEFLAILLENRSYEEVAAFCRDHLDWLEALRKEAAARGIRGMFEKVVQTAESLVNDIVSVSCQ